MYLYQNTENSQNKHQILNRIVKSIEKQVKYSDVDNYFWKLIKKQDKLLKIAYENNDSSKWDEIKAKTKLFICAKQLAKLQHFIKSHWHNKKFQAQELYVFVKQDTESKYGWNYKTNKKWRKITLTDYATIIGYSSSTPVKLNWLLNKSTLMLLHILILLLYIRNLSNQTLRLECLNDFFLARKKLMIISVECLI